VFFTGHGLWVVKIFGVTFATNEDSRAKSDPRRAETIGALCAEINRIRVQIAFWHTQKCGISLIKDFEPHTHPQIFKRTRTHTSTRTRTRTKTRAH
jgi:hypothetical protein